VNISGPINDFNKKLSTFFTYLIHLKCKTSSFLSNITFSYCSFFVQSGKEVQRLNGTTDHRRNGTPAQCYNGLHEVIVRLSMKSDVLGF